MKFLSIICIASFISFCSVGQSKDSVALYRLLNQDLNLTKPVSFLTIRPIFENLESPNPPLTVEEGRDGFLVDSQFFIKFPLWEKRVYEQGNPKNNSIRPFFGYSRLYIDYGFSGRVARNVKSSPSLPITNRYGLRWDKVFAFKYTYDQTDSSIWKFKNVWAGCGKVETIKLHEINVKYRFWYFSLYAHHYSNGGNEGVLNGDRNDYVSGDHSTSFFRFSLGQQIHNGTKSHTAWEFGYQKELGDTTTFFSFPIEQEKRYGRHRLVGSVQHIQGFKKGFIEYIKFRTDMELILGNLMDFPYDNKYWLGTHIFLDAPIRPAPGVGLLFHGYVGRDYLNIRYDNPVYTLQLGLSLSINRYSLNIFEKPTPSE